MLGGISGWCDTVGAFTPSSKMKNFGSILPSILPPFHLPSLSCWVVLLGGVPGQGITVGYVGLFLNLLLAPSLPWLAVLIRVIFSLKGH